MWLGLVSNREFHKLKIVEFGRYKGRVVEFGQIHKDSPYATHRDEDRVSQPTINVE
jgi:hypothetical protein